jgi:hypothetical protein
LCDRFDRSVKIAIDKETFLAVDLADNLDSFAEGGAATLKDVRPGAESWGFKRVQ